MLTPGRVWWLFNKARREGFRTLVYEHWVRKRILQTPCIRTNGNGDVEVHVLTCAGDWLNLLWALKSFYLYSGRTYPLVIHEDGSLGEEAIERLRRHCPDARLIRRAESDAVMTTRLARCPRCAQYRASHPLALKAFDFGQFLERPRLLLLDSDLLFFQSPGELLRRLDDPHDARCAFNADVASALNISAADAWDCFGIRLVERINSGLAILPGEALALEQMEEFLAHPSLMAGHFWRIEQSLLALAASRWGVDLLPAEYRVMLSEGIEGCVAKHYVGAVRHLMYREGMAHLVKTGFLDDLAANRTKATTNQPGLAQ